VFLSFDSATSPKRDSVPVARHAESIAKLVGEMKVGTQDRVKPPYVENIVEVLRDRVAEKSA